MKITKLFFVKKQLYGFLHTLASENIKEMQDEEKFNHVSVSHAYSSSLGNSYGSPFLDYQVKVEDLYFAI